MCLSIPAKVMSIENDKAIVSIGGTEYEASLQLLEDVQIGDYILLHTGFAIQKLSEEEAQETFQLFKEIEDIGNKL